MTRDRFECVDAGSEYCPCYLAETNDCITCSHLQGKKFCECNCQGVCIYQEYVWNGFKSKSSRNEFVSQIIERNEISDNITMLKLKVSRTIARQLKEPGAYVFLRVKDSQKYFDVPISIMDSNDLDGYIRIAYKKLGVKTKRIDNEQNELLIRGPYWNGLLGIKNLKKIKNGKCLIIVRGVAQAPSILVIKKLINNGNKVFLVLDKGNLEKLFIDEFIKDIDIEVFEENIMNKKGKELIENIMSKENIDLVFSGGSDLQHISVIDLIDKLNINPYLVVTNNIEICCGEGICGSCSVYLQDGVVIKACKTQMDARKIIERRVSID